MRHLAHSYSREFTGIRTTEKGTNTRGDTIQVRPPRVAVPVFDGLCHPCKIIREARAMIQNRSARFPRGLGLKTQPNQSGGCMRSRTV